MQQAQRDIPVKTKLLLHRGITVSLFVPSKSPPLSTLQFEDWRSEGRQRGAARAASPWVRVPR